MDLSTNINFNTIKIIFDSIDFKWRYEPEIKIKLNYEIPTLPDYNFHLFKALTVELPFYNQEKKIAFLYKYKNQVYGFFNLCSHVKVPLDLDDNRFFNVMGNIVCKVHGAQFCPLTGNVISGPARSPLIKVDFILEEEDEYLIIRGFYF